MLYLAETKIIEFEIENTKTLQYLAPCPLSCDHVTQTGPAYQQNHFARKVTKRGFLPGQIWPY